MVGHMNEPNGYRGRVADGLLKDRLRSSGAVLLEGPKACGKTATASRVAATTFRLDTDEAARSAVGIDPSLLLDQPTPVLFDEWQIEPAMWNLVRRAVDDRNPLKGQFILTGSATPDDDVMRHSGAGRIAAIQMRPMSLLETGHSTGEVSLAALFEGAPARGADTGMMVSKLIERIVIGGWPALLDASPQDAMRWLRDYLRQIVEVDVPSLENGRRNPRNLRRLLASLGRNVGTGISVAALAKDVGGSDGPVSRNAIYDYLDVFERLMIVEDVPAWATHMRSAARLRKSATRYMVDPSLALAALGAGPEQLMADLNATGFHFEALVVRDLHVYSQPLDGVLSHWRDSSGHEVDVVVELSDSRWGAFEVKMGLGSIDAAAASLLRFAAKVDTAMVGQPAFLGVITTTGFSYRRPDGIDVIPIGLLGP